MQKYFNIADELINNKKLEASFLATSNSVKKYKGKNGLKKESFTITNNEHDLKNGNYSIISFQNIMIATPKMINYLVNHLSLELGKYVGKLNSNSRVLVVALGNKNISADSLGYNTIKNIIVSSLYSNLSFFEGVPKTYAITTSVLGLTGVESSDIVKGVVQNIKPDLIIVIDTLCTTNYKRIGTSFQINNVGIVPGGGINNKRKELNRQNLGVPVISVGVPLVMYGYSLLENALRKVENDFIANNNIKKGKASNASINTNQKDDYEKLQNNFVSVLQKENFNNLLITIKDIEEVVKVCGQVVAMSINKAITGFSVEKQKQIIYRL